MGNTVRHLSFKKRFVTFAVYDIIERSKGVYHRDKLTGEISAELNVYDNVNSFRIIVKDACNTDESIMHIICDTDESDISARASQRAVNFLADSVEQLLENELLMAKNLKIGITKRELV